MGFIFGGDTGITYDDLKRRKEVAEALLAQSMRAPRNVGEGLTAIGNALSGSILEKRANKRQAEMDKESMAAINAILTGGGGPAYFAPPRGPAGGAAPPAGGSGAPVPPPPPPSTDGAPTGGMDPEMAANEVRLAPVEWALGPNRPNKPNDAIVNLIQRGVAETYGPGAKVIFTSGTEGDLPQYGSPRHKTGNAGDFKVRLPNGSIVSGDKAMDPLATWFAKNGALGIGYGSDYMGGNHFHIDTVTPTGGMAHTWGGRGKARRDELTNIILGRGAPVATTAADAHAGHNHPPGAHGAAPPSFSSAYPSGNNKTAALLALMMNNRYSPQVRDMAKMLYMQEAAKNRPPSASDALARERFEWMKGQADADRALKEREFELRSTGKWGGGVTVNNTMPNGVTLPKPPKDHLWQRNADGTPYIDPETRLPVAVPVPGGPAATKAGAAAAAEAARNESAVNKTGLVAEDIKRAIDAAKAHPGWRTGFLGSLLKDIAGTGAHDLQNVLATVKANIGFDRLDQMRRESPTGGALGQVSERELTFLQSVLGSLEQSQSADQLIANLERVGKTYDDIMRKFAAYPEFANDPALAPWREKAAPKVDLSKPPSGADPRVHDLWPGMSDDMKRKFIEHYGASPDG